MGLPEEKRLIRQPFMTVRKIRPSKLIMREAYPTMVYNKDKQSHSKRIDKIRNFKIQREIPGMKATESVH